MTQLEALLQQCTVKLTLPGRMGWGTGFFVAPEWILTCTHVVQEATGQPIQVRWQNQENWTQAVVERSLPDPYDLALLRVTLPIDANPPCVYLDAAIQSRDPLYLFGYPDQDFPNGCPVTFSCEGLTGDEPALIKFALGQVRPGMSGAPLLNQRTGKVCGIVKFTRDRSFDLGGGAMPTRVILEQFPQLREFQREFHQCDRRWSNLIAKQSEIDFQPYLNAIASTYEKWWQFYTLTDAAGKQRQSQEVAPIVDFGLMVQTVKKEEREQRQEEKVKPFRVLEGLRKYADQQVLLVGRPGSGKSTALARLMLEMAAPLAPQVWGEPSQIAVQSPPELGSQCGLGVSPSRAPGVDLGGKIPVLVELRYWQGSIAQLILNSFARHELPLTAQQLETVLPQLLILFDGVNELPSEEARSQLSAFRRNHPKLPMIFTTRDLSLGGDLGIEQKLEMQPLTEGQMKAFIRAYVPEQAEAMLRQLRDRLREFGQTPLLLWMLCEVFQQTPNNQLPSNLAGVFQVFTNTYEISSVRKHEVALLKGDVKPLSDRRLWKKALKALASVMMQGETRVDFRVVIHRDEAERELSRIFPTEQFPVRDILDDLLKYHLLQNRSVDQIEFRQQLIQEYYAAESLLQLLPDLSDEQLTRDYLNYLKWTEAIALMLTLVAQEAHALRVVKLALAVDRRLGAKLAGAVQPALQATTAGWLKESTIPELLTVELLGSTKSVEAIPGLLEAFKNSDFSVRWAAATALGHINGKESVQALWSASKDPAYFVRLASIAALGTIGNSAAIEALLKILENAVDDDAHLHSAYELGKLGNKVGIQRLSEALNHQESSVIHKAISGLKFLNTEASTVVLLEALQHPKIYVRTLAVQALGEIGNDAWIPHLLKVMNHEDSRSHEIISLDESVVNALGRMGSEQAIASLLSIAECQNFLVRRQVLELLGNLNCKTAVPTLQKALKDEDVAIRGIAATSLGQIGNELAVPDLLQALDDDGYVCANSARSLRQIGSRDAVPKLLQMLTDEDYHTRWSASDALGKIGGLETIAELSKLLRHPNLQTRRIAAKTLGLIGDKATIPELMEALEEEEQLIAAKTLELNDNGADVAELTEEIEASEGVIVNLAVALMRLNCCVGTLVLVQKLEHLTPHGLIWVYFSFDLFRDLEIEAAIPVL